MSGMSGIRASVWILLILPAFAAGHHGNTEYDLSVALQYEGVVLEHIWRNPHTLTRLETQTQEGERIVLEIEGGSPSILRTGGFTADSIKSGERVTAVVSPSKRFPKESAYGYELIKSNGSSVPLVGSRVPKPQLIVPAADIFTTWVPTAESFVEFTRSARSWPLTEKGQRVRAEYAPTSSAQARCLPIGAPLLMVYPVVMLFERTGDNVSIKTDWLGAERTIQLGGATAPPSGERSMQGYSVGRWEANVLIVETTHFTDEAQVVPTGAGKRLVERFALAEDGRSLTYTFEMEDPEYLRGRISGTAQMIHRPDLRPAGIECDRELAERFFREFR